MTLIIEHKNGDQRSVRADLASEYVACVHCKGMGTRWRGFASVGRLWYDGWQHNYYRQSWCDDCGGAGIWREAAAHSSTEHNPIENIEGRQS